MLEGMLTTLIGEYNFQRHLARYNGRLLSALGDKVSEPMKFWGRYPYHSLYFSCNNIGIICKLGDKQDFPEKEMEGHYVGRFRIAIDQAQLDAAKKAGSSADFPHERIIDIRFYKGVPPKVYHRIKEAAALYNGHFGFSRDYHYDDYDGFAAGNFLEENSLRGVYPDRR